MRRGNVAGLEVYDCRRRHEVGDQTVAERRSSLKLFGRRPSPAVVVAGGSEQPPEVIYAEVLLEEGREELQKQTPRPRYYFGHVVRYREKGLAVRKATRRSRTERSKGQLKEAIVRASSTSFDRTVESGLEYQSNSA